MNKRQQIFLGRKIKSSQRGPRPLINRTRKKVLNTALSKCPFLILKRRVACTGSLRNYTKRRCYVSLTTHAGKNVLSTYGLGCFGLPLKDASLSKHKNSKPANGTTEKTSPHEKAPSLKELGFWAMIGREIATLYKPEYYKGRTNGSSPN